MRKLVLEGAEYQVVHQDLLCDVLLLCTSTYSEVSPPTQTQPPLLVRSDLLRVPGPQPSSGPAGLRPQNL